MVEAKSEINNLNRYKKIMKISNIKIEEVKTIINTPQKFFVFLDGIFKYWIRDNESNVLPPIMRKVQDINTWIEKSNYLIKGINISLTEAIKIIEDNFVEFYPLSIKDKDKVIFYFLENATYRVFSLWDVLGQMYNLYYNLGEKISGVNHSKIFSAEKYQYIILNIIKEKTPNEEYYKIVKEYYLEIKRYIKASDGDYKYIKEIRNSFTHRNNPHDFTVLNKDGLGFNMPDHPLLEISKIANVYYKLFFFIDDILKLFYLEFSCYGIGRGPEIKNYNPIKRELHENDFK